MKKSIPYALLAFFVIIIGCSKNEPICTITGTVINPQDNSIILFKPNEDPQFGNVIKIPIIDGKIKYEIEIDMPIGYDLMYGKDGSPGGNYMTVFLEKGNVELTIYPEEEWDKNTIHGGKTNNEFASFKKEKDNLFENRLKPLYDKMTDLQGDDNYYSEAMKILREERTNASSDELKIILNKIDLLRKTKTNLSESARKLQDEISEIYKEEEIWVQNYRNENTNIISYYLLLTELSYSKNVDIISSKNNFERLNNKFPNHPYMESIELKISSLANLKVENKFIDFSLPDLNGNIFKLSDEINGKVALIDLWATWCAPCILNSRAIIPIYEEFKDKGFTVVGVAGEFENTENLEKRLEAEKFPWLNLVELDGANFIWEMYGVPRSGGGMFLVDKDGRILAIEPTLNEVRNILEKIIE